jgi:hypothetical protein
MLEMSGNNRVYVNCARCTKNIAVTFSYKERMDSKFLPILCNDCRNQSEVTI